MQAQQLAPALAAHRFGLGEADLAVVGSDARAWLLAQIGPAEPQRGVGLLSGAQALARQAAFAMSQRQPTMGQAGMAGMVDSAKAAETPAPAPAPAQAPAQAAAQPTPQAEALRQAVQADLRARLATAAASRQPFNERLALFWANHFTVSAAKAGARGVVGAFEREAIRPHIAGRFADLLKAAVQHGGMLRYLDQDRSAGPDSPLVRRLARRAALPDMPAARTTGLNENLARELLELHTLGAAGGGTGGGADHGGWGGHSQADVTALAGLLTGWRVPPPAALAEPGAATVRFDAAWHQPGAKTVLGQRHAEGPEALDAVLQQLARHPSTARFIAFKLARHFAGDEPPPALVARLASNFSQTGGDLPGLYRTLLQSPEAWGPAPAKLKTPEEFVLSSLRLLQLGDSPLLRLADGAAAQLGQRLQAAPSPAGWPDRADEWLGPDAVWKRLEWASRMADRLGSQVDARALASASLGPLLSEASARQIERAADGRQALALLLLAPEFQRR